MPAARPVDDWSDPLLPTQLDTLCASADRAPERRLLAAVLLDAICQLRRGGTTRAVEAERWIRARNAEYMPCSFGMVCAVLGLNAESLARVLLDRAGGATLAEHAARRRAGRASAPRPQITLVRRRRRHGSVRLAG